MSVKIKEIIGIEDIEKIQDNIFVLYVDDEPKEIVLHPMPDSMKGKIPTLDLFIESYIRLDSLPLDLKNKVRAHFGLEQKLK